MHRRRVTKLEHPPDKLPGLRGALYNIFINKLYIYNKATSITLFPELLGHIRAYGFEDIGKYLGITGDEIATFQITVTTKKITR